MSDGRMPTSGGPIASEGSHRLSRRAFLQAASLSGAALLAARLPAHGVGEDAPRPDPVAELAAELEFDADRIFRFVADEVRYEPYEGVLRGARGTLAARAGNSADQALLLAALLKASLVPCRFAVGPIDAATAEALETGTAADAPTIRKDALQALEGAIPGATGHQPQELPAEVRELAERGLEAAARVVEWGRAELETTVRTLSTALDEAGVTLPGGFTSVPAGERERHVWVQRAATAEWLDLDPTLAGTGPGGPPPGATETMDALPDDWAHSVDLAVIAESLSGGRLEEETLLALTDRSERMAGEPIVCLNVPPAGLAGLGTGVAEALVGERAYLPVIIVGDEAFVARAPVRFGGSGAAPGSSPSGDPSGPLADDFLGGSGDLETTAEWLELTVRSPGREPVVVRREIFDRLGPAAREAWTASTQAALDPVPVIELEEGEGRADLPALGAHWLLVDVGMPGRGDRVAGIGLGDDGRDLALIPLSFHLLRQAASMELALPLGVRPFIDAPNVASFSVHMHPDAGGEHAIETVPDIWHRSYGTAPVVGQGLELPPSLVPGVLAHVTERLLAGTVSAMETVPGTRAASVGAILEAARAEGVPLRVLRDRGEAGELAYPADARRRLAEALGKGWLAVAPERGIELDGLERAGWWLVDPAEGHAVDMLDDGRGAEPLEYAATVEVVVVQAAAPARRFALHCIAATFAAVVAVLGVMLTGLSIYADTAWGAALGGGGATGGGIGWYILLRNCLAG